MNKIILSNVRLTVDTELKTTNSGVEVCTFSVACDRYCAKGAEKVTDFITCKAWRQNGVFVNTYFKKGQAITIEGNLHIDRYEKDGENKTFAYVNVEHAEFCGSKSSGNNAPYEANTTTAPAAPYIDISTASGADDLPF